MPKRPTGPVPKSNVRVVRKATGGRKKPASTLKRPSTKNA